MTHFSEDELQAIQNVVDRVGGYQDGAPEGTIERELRNGLSDAGIEVENRTVARLASAIAEQHANVDAASVLAQD